GSSTRCRRPPPAGRTVTGSCRKGRWKTRCNCDRIAWHRIRRLSPMIRIDGLMRIQLADRRQGEIHHRDSPQSTQRARREKWLAKAPGHKHAKAPRRQAILFVNGMARSEAERREESPRRHEGHKESVEG